MNSKELEEISEEILEHAHFKLLGTNPRSINDQNTLDYVKEFKRRLLGIVKAREAKEIEESQKCICKHFSDTGGYRVSDLSCCVHGVNGTNPGDGYWEEGE